MFKLKLTAHLLRRQHPFPIWDLREGHLGPPREREETIAPRAASMASGHPLDPLAICLEIRDVPPQHPACFGQWHLQTRDIQLNQSLHEVRAHAYLQMPCVHPPK